MKDSTELIIKKMPYDIFTAADLINLFEGSSSRRYGLVKRAIACGDIIQIRRGLYCLPPGYQRRGMNVYSVAQRIYGPSYVSLESSLSYHGWIPESVHTVTSASMKKSKEFRTPLGLFSFKRIPCSIFYCEVERIEPSPGDVFFMASAVKALIDYVYVYKKDWEGMSSAIDDLRLDPVNFKNIRPAQLKALKQAYRNFRVKRFIGNIQKDLGYEH